MLDQPAAEYRPDYRCDRAQARPRSDGAAALACRKRIANDGETSRNEKSGPEPLKRARRNQLANVPGQSASRRCQRKERNSYKKDEAAPIMIAERTPDEQERRK